MEASSPLILTNFIDNSSRIKVFGFVASTSRPFELKPYKLAINFFCEGDLWGDEVLLPKICSFPFISAKEGRDDTNTQTIKEVGKKEDT